MRELCERRAQRGGGSVPTSTNHIATTRTVSAAFTDCFAPVIDAIEAVAALAAVVVDHLTEQLELADATDDQPARRRPVHLCRRRRGLHRRRGRRPSRPLHRPAEEAPPAAPRSTHPMAPPRRRRPSPAGLDERLSRTADRYCASAGSTSGWASRSTRQPVSDDDACRIPDGCVGKDRSARDDPRQT